ncbi:MAG TPA: GNAT family N-acetyltransferase [Phycisphaerales bacterium]|nr:GNAT family N-acetyltransferase [Phycisphaerales bacterium]
MLTVLSVAFPFVPVAPDAPGGAEQVLAMLDAALVDAGHRSLVIACEGSNVRGELVATPRPRDGEDRDRAWTYYQQTISRVLAREPVSIVHYHGLDFHAYLPPPPPSGPPTLVTLHLPTGWYDPRVKDLAGPHVYLHAVSRSQHDECAWRERLLPPIDNGVRTDVPWSLDKGRYALMLGRVCPQKNQRDAIAACTRAGVPLLIAGDVLPYEEHRRYFATEVAPQLGRGARFLGHAAGEFKHRLLSRARCVLIPSTQPETSSLVAMEALAHATPVIAYRRGNLPHILRDGVTGLLVDLPEEMAGAIAGSDRINPRDCRDDAARRFSVSRMTAQYLDRYSQLARAPSRHRPRARPQHAVLTSLEELRSLEPEWATLAAADARATPFQHPAWLIPWAEHFAPGPLRVATVRSREGELRALVPMYRDRHSDQLLPLGIGNSDYLDALCMPGADADALAALHRLLEGGADQALIPQLRSCSPLAASESTEPAEPCVVLDFTGRALADVLPAKMQQNLRTITRRAVRAGVTTHRLGARDDAAASLFELFRLHRARWEAREQNGVLADPRVQSFLRDAAQRLHQAGMLRLVLVKSPQAVIGAALGLADPHARVVFYYIGGFDPAHAELSPGTLAVSALIHDAHAAGAARFDFLRGLERYKFLWGGREAPTRSLCVRARRRVAA